MADLTPTAYLSKWNQRFATNDTFDVDEADLRENALDQTKTFVAKAQLTANAIRGNTLLLDNLDDLLLVDQGVLVIGQGAIVANATTAANSAINIQAGQATFRLIKDSAGPLLAYLDIKVTTLTRTKASWVRTDGTDEQKKATYPLFQEEDYQYAIGDVFQYTGLDGATLLYEVLKTNAQQYNPLPTGVTDANYKVFAPLPSTTGKSITELVLPQGVEAGKWYVYPDGIWEARAKFNASAPPVPGANWRRVVQFSTYTDGQAVAAVLSSGQFVATTDARLLQPQYSRSFELTTEPGSGTVFVFRMNGAYTLSTVTDYINLGGASVQVIKKDGTAAAAATTSLQTFNNTVAALSPADQAWFYVRYTLTPSDATKAARTVLGFYWIGTGTPPVGTGLPQNVVPLPPASAAGGASNVYEAAALANEPGFVLLENGTLKNTVIPNLSRIFFDKASINSFISSGNLYPGTQYIWTEANGDLVSFTALKPAVPGAFGTRYSNSVFEPVKISWNGSIIGWSAFSAGSSLPAGGTATDYLRGDGSWQPGRSQANGLAALDSSGKVPSGQLPSTVVELSIVFPAAGAQVQDIYINQQRLVGSVSLSSQTANMANVSYKKNNALVSLPVSVVLGDKLTVTGSAPTGGALIVLTVS